MSTLNARTLELLKADPRPLTQLSIESKIPYHWLSSYRYGKAASPSVDRVQALYEFLTGKSLPLE